MNGNGEIDYTQELLRKGIHLLALAIPIVYALTNKEIMLWLMIPITTISITLDIFSRRKTKAQVIMHKIFGNMLRPHEYNDELSLNGASWVLLSGCICIIIFPKIITITGLSILIISDISAALIGRKIGKHKLFDKSWEGTGVFWLSALIIVGYIGIVNHAPWTFFLFGSISALIGGIIEAASHVLRVDDNISIPMTIGIILWIGGLISIGLNAPYMNLM